MVARLFGACGYADARRGWQKAERAAAATSGRTGGDTSAKSFYFPCGRSKPAATQGVLRSRESVSHRRMVPPRLFLSPPSFFFTHEKERWGAGGSQARTARGVIPRIPTQYPIGLYCPAGQSGNPRRGFPAVKHPTGMFYVLPALFWGRDSASRGTRRNVKSPCRRRPGSPRR